MKYTNEKKMTVGKIVGIKFWAAVYISGIVAFVSCLNYATWNEAFTPAALLYAITYVFLIGLLHRHIFILRRIPYISHSLKESTDDLDRQFFTSIETEFGTIEAYERMFPWLSSPPLVILAVICAW